MTATLLDRSGHLSPTNSVLFALVPGLARSPTIFCGLRAASRCKTFPVRFRPPCSLTIRERLAPESWPNHLLGFAVHYLMMLQGALCTTGRGDYERAWRDIGYAQNVQKATYGECRTRDIEPLTNPGVG